MKRLILLSLYLYLPFIIWSFDFQLDNFNFDFDRNSDNVILRSQIAPTSKVDIPSKVSFRGRDFNVTKIGDNAFRGSNLKEVNFCEGLLEIGDNAFRNTKIEKVVFPDSHQQLGEYAFADCPNLVYVEFGKGIISSSRWRTLRYTFVNDDNIEKIVFRGNHPPLNFDNMPFSKMTRQFAKIYVPLNGYYNFTDANSPWKICFSNKIIPYQPEDNKPEIVPYCMYFWDDEKVTNKYIIKGSRTVYNSYKGTETYPLSLIIEECPDRFDNVMIRITYRGELSDQDVDFVDSGIFFCYCSKDVDYSKFEGELWRIINPDEEPVKEKISFDFKKIKKPGLLKSKLVNGIEVRLIRNKSEKKSTFILDELPPNFNIKFEE